MIYQQMMSEVDKSRFKDKQPPEDFFFLSVRNCQSGEQNGEEGAIAF